MPRTAVTGITIDAPETRDIDDAVWVEVADGGQTTVTISIADVSRHVKLGGQIDTWAREQVATRYFRSGNRPMLPRSLSERALSLLPDTHRKTLTVEVCLGGDAKLHASSIKSAARLSYPEIPGIVLDAEHPWHDRVSLLAGVAMRLLEQRRAAGALVLYDLNNGWVTTEEGWLKRLESKQATIGYIIVQELMILANARVAELCVKNDIPVPFRNHQARAAAPDRAELMAQIQGAMQAPLATLELVRLRTHLLLEKAEYGADLKGHYGLNLPAYLHFTSPIRRYADLVTHRQICAWLEQKPLPYTKDDIAAVCAHVNEVERVERETTSEHLKAKAERRAQSVVNAEAIVRLSEKDFERVVKVNARSGDDASAEFEEAYLARLERGDVTLVCMAAVLTESKGLPGWLRLRAATVAHLSPEGAVSLLAMVTQTVGWPAVTYDVSHAGPDHARTFTATATIQSHRGDARRAGLVVDERCATQQATRTANALKEAKQRAAHALLAAMTGVEPVAPGVAAVVPAQATHKPYAFDPSKHPVSALSEWAQVTGGQPAVFDFDREGADHVPTFVCRCKVGNIEGVGRAGSKQEAKKLAAEAAVRTLGGSR